MSRMFFGRKKLRFTKCVLAEAGGKDVYNPGRGWYSIFTLDPAEGFAPEIWESSLVPDQRLVLLMVDLGRFRAGIIPDSGLAVIDRAMAFFGAHQRDMILRFVYDRQGEGMLREPDRLSAVCGHIRQLGDVAAAHENDIFCVQGLLVGSWGEMHTSRYVSPGHLKTLASEMAEAMPDNCFLAVRRPVQWRQIHDGGNIRQLYGCAPWDAHVIRLRTGIFNDGMLGSSTDLGTYGTESTEGSRWTEMWGAEEELLFQDRLCRHVPAGGEAVSGENGIAATVREAARRFAVTHVSYLNSQHQREVLERWRQETVEDTDGYSYIGAHLGYRFVVTDAELTLKNGPSLHICVENRGFAPVYQQVQAELILCGDSGEERHVPVPCDPRSWMPGAASEVTALLPNGLFPEGKDGCPWDVYLYLHRVSDGYRIRTANRDGGDRLLLGRLDRR